MSTNCSSPAKKTLLPQNVDGPPARGSINYASVIGMLLYLTGHSRLDCSFKTNQCVRYTFAPTNEHKHALVQIGRHGKRTIDKGLTLSPGKNLHTNCYPNADFAGLWKDKDDQDPHCVWSWTDYIILLAQYSGQVNSKQKLPYPPWKQSTLH